MPIATDQAQEPGLVFRVLGTLPRFRGKWRLARALTSASSRGREALVSDRQGNRLVVPNLLEPLAFSLAVDRIHEPELVDLLGSHLSAETAFIDVGANIGAITLALAPAASRVIAIEASPKVLPFLEKNVARNAPQKIRVFPCAVSKPGVDSVAFYMPPMESFGMGSTAPQFNVAPIVVPAKTLDAVIAESGVERIGAVKVDVEGYEAHVFLGAEKLLRTRPSPLIAFEFLDWAEERAFPGQRGWAQQIVMDAGLTCWRMEDFPDPAKALSKPLTEGSHAIVATAR